MSSQPRVITPRVIIQMLALIVLVPLLPLLITRRWNWWEAWFYALAAILSFAISRVLVARRNPDLIAERIRFMQHEDAPAWDKKLTPFLGIGNILIVVTAGLDGLYGWSPGSSLPMKVLAMLIILAGYTLSSYALIENRFFSGMVHLQTDRGQRVVSSGPYRWIRHPGYAGGVWAYLATPVLLDSSWAFLPALFTVGLFVIRTALEDRFLQAELAGYRDYARQVRYRLLPGVW